MAKTSQPAVSPICRYLGMWDDPAGYIAYPSSGNRCYRTRRPGMPGLLHQQVYCLSGKGEDCPVYAQPEGKAFPSEFQANESSVLVRRTPSAPKNLAWAIAVLVLGFVGWQFGRAVTPWYVDKPTPAATATTQVVAVIAARPAGRPSPTASPVPTPTMVPPVHALEIPVTGGQRELLLHRVHGGETFEMVASTFDTKPEVIRSLNYGLRPSLWANTVIVVAPGLQVVDPALPAFRVIQVTEGATTEKLASKYNVPTDLIEVYNGCGAGCQLAVGDWLMIPVMK